MKVTSTQIAKRLGVSRSTVSRALSGHPYVEEDLRSRILTAATEMGYRPNLAAQSLARGESLLIGVVVFTKPEEYWERVLRGIDQAAKQLHDYGVVVEPVIADILNPQEQIDAMHALVARGARAIVLAPSAPDEVAETIDELTGKGIQVVLLSHDIPQTRRLCYVGCDFVQSGKLAGELLCRFLRGNGRIATIVYDDSGAMISQKLTGFREEIGRFQHVEMVGPFRYARTGEHVYENTREMICTAKPDAIYMTYGSIEEVARAVVDEGLGGKLPLVGHDLSTNCLNYLQKRVIYAMIVQEPEQQGMLSIRILHDYISHSVRPKNGVIHSRLDIITTQNSQYYDPNALSTNTYYFL